MGIKKEAMKILAQILKNKYIMAGAPAIIRNQKGEILLGKRDEHAPCYPSMWGLPGGMINYGESLEGAIKREVKEELGVEIRIIKYGKPCMHFPTKKCPLQTLDAPVYCKIKKGKPKPKDETTEVRWFSPKEIKNMELAYAHKKILQQEGMI